VLKAEIQVAVKKRLEKRPEEHYGEVCREHRASEE
jgi:hypothetical protein